MSSSTSAANIVVRSASGDTDELTAARLQANDWPFVSIIVAAKDEEDGIEACLESLLGQDYDGYEIIIVDTGSTDNTREIASRMADKNQRLRLLTTLGNASVGRNVGIKEAKGNILAFIDGDCIATRGWLKDLVGSLVIDGHPTVGVGGPNVPQFSVETRWSRAANSSLNTFLGSGGSAQVRSTNNRYVRAISTANSAFWTESIRSIGCFDPRLDLCEDSDLCSRLTRGGLKLRFEKNAVVYHRRDYRNLWKFGEHMFKYGKWRGKAIIIKPRTNASRTSLALLGVLGILVTLSVLFLSGSAAAGALLELLVGLYLTALAVNGLLISRGIVGTLASIPTILVLHLSYTTGLVSGILSSIPRVQRQ